MFPIEKNEYFKLWDIRSQNFEKYFYSEDELILFISSNYHRVYLPSEDRERGSFSYSNYILDYSACSSKDKGEKLFQLFDSYDRIINMHDYTDAAFELYQKRSQEGSKIYYPTYAEWKQKQHYKKRKKKRFASWYWLIQRDNAKFRAEPVPKTGKYHLGFPGWRQPKAFRIMKMYDNPDFYFFNRGSRDDYNMSHYDCPYRNFEKSWKRQSKRRHQWKPKD
jgi:hypothetical protein